MSFLRGIGFGIFLVILVEVAIIYIVFIKLTSERRLTDPSDGERPENVNDIPGEIDSLIWPAAVKERLKRLLTPNALDVVVGQKDKNSEMPPFETLMMTPTIEADWLNLILLRLFVTLRSSKVFQKRWALKMSNKINLKLKGNSFISKLIITDIKLGDHPPSIEGVRLLKGITKDLAVSGELDLIYRGGASISIQTVITNGSVIPMQVFMNEFNGTVRARLPSERWADMLGFAFLEDPGVTFRVESSITVADNQMLRNMVNNVLSTIMRKTFLELWVLPSWRTAFLPLLEPSLEDWLAREDLDQAKRSKATMASRASQLWESAPLAPNLHSLLKRPVSEKLKDCLEGIVFDTQSILPRNPVEIAEDFEQPLLRAFVALATEPTEENDNIPSRKPSKSEEDESSMPLLSSSRPSLWKTVRNKTDIMIWKRRTVDTILGTASEVTRAAIPINCDLSRVFTIISNPIHFRHIYDSFLDAKILFEEGGSAAHTCTFQIGKSEKNFLVYQAKSDISDNDFRYVVMRSIADISAVDEDPTEPDSESSDTVRQRKGKKPLSRPTYSAENSMESDMSNSPPPSKKLVGSGVPVDGQVYVFGYYIAKITDSTCLVTILSQLSTSFQKLEVDVSLCRKLKQFIEELTQLTDGEIQEPYKMTGIKKILSPENEKRVREKLASYIGTAKSFLQKRKSSLGPDILVPPSSSLSDELTNASAEHFGRKPVVERFLAPKEVFNLEIPFIRQDHGENVYFQWEYISLSEQTPTYSIRFIPDTTEQISDTINLLPFGESRGRILFPLSHIQCYAKPSYGSMDLSDFNSGKVVLTWENNLPLSMRSAKHINFKTFISDEYTLPEVNAQISIPRKSFFSLPLVFKTSSEPHDIRIEFSTGSVAVPFALYFDKATESTSIPNVSERLNSAVQGSTPVEAFSQGPLRKTLIQFSSVKPSITPSKTIHRVAAESSGVYTLTWDNSSSVVSTRQISFHVNFIKCSRQL